VRGDNRIFRPRRQPDPRRVRADLERFAVALIDQPVASDERRFHHDLPELSVPALRVEGRRLLLAVLLHKTPPAWAVARLSAIEAELEARRGG
jgi:hypothetical protein